MAVSSGGQRRHQPTPPRRDLDSSGATPGGPPEPAAPENEALRFERESELHTALAKLPPDGRAALLLAAQGFDGHEIAASIGRTEGATRTLLCRSRVQLRLVLEAAEGQP